MAARDPNLSNENKSTTSFSVDGKTAIVTGAGSGIIQFLTSIYLFMYAIPPKLIP
jgi:hypothetical protein